jgi:isopenicillin N synthase-like dioxygenase
MCLLLAPPPDPNFRTSAEHRSLYMSHQVPTISLSTERPRQDIVDEIRAACLTYGFFQITEYTYIVSHVLQSRALEVSQRFFELPLSAKQSLVKVDHIAGGYEPYKIMNLDPSDKNGYGHNEGFSFAAAPNPTAWPEESLVPGFRETMVEYYNAVSSLAEELGRYIAIGLGLSEYYFDDFFQDQLAHVKLAHYYRPEGAEDARSNVGVAPHTDWGAVTILAQDHIGGLEVFDQSTSEWIKVDISIY